MQNSQIQQDHYTGMGSRRLCYVKVCFILSKFQVRISDLHRKLRFSGWSENRPVLKPQALLFWNVITAAVIWTLHLRTSTFSEVCTVNPCCDCTSSFGSCFKNWRAQSDSEVECTSYILQWKWTGRKCRTSNSKSVAGYTGPQDDI